VNSEQLAVCDRFHPCAFVVPGTFPGIEVVSDDKNAAARGSDAASGGAAGSRDPTRQAGAAGRPTLVDEGNVEARIEAAVSKIADDEQPARDPLIGRLIDNRFEVLSRLGAGGMGVVYRARQVGIDRIVAIKTLLKDRAQDGKVVMRFKNEARAVSKLNHPNTIRIHDFGQMDDGTLYFAMELLEGRPLDKAIRQDGPFSARRSIHVMTQMADSLAEAHSKGIVHRDLKPENVYLCAVGDDPDFVKVLDFGVARMKEQDHSQGTMTQAGVIFGTPRYMAPEQARTMAVDARADIYALGVIWFEMLTGRTPFDADNPLAILMKHIQDSVPPMASVRPDVSVPPEVEEMVRRCLEKSADRRFQSAAALAAEARAVLDRLDGRYERVVFVDKQATDQPDQPPSEPVEVPLPARRRRGPAGLLIAVSVLAVLGTASGIGWTMFMRDSAATPSDATVVIPDPAAPPLPPPAPVAALAPDAGPQKDAVAQAGSPAVVQAQVKVRFESVPAGARVLLDGVELGLTPFEEKMPVEAEPMDFVFRLAGHSDVSSRLERDTTLSAVLSPVPEAPRVQQEGRARPAAGVRRQPPQAASPVAPAPSAPAPASNPVAATPSAPAAPQAAPAPAPAPEKPSKPAGDGGFRKVGGDQSPAGKNAPGKVGDLKKF